MQHKIQIQILQRPQTSSTAYPASYPLCTGGKTEDVWNPPLTSI